MGLDRASDPDGEGGRWFFDPERAQRARKMGEYVYQYVLHVLAVYAGLLLKRLTRSTTPASKDALPEFDAILTREFVDEIVSKMGGYIADRHARPGREADLPFFGSLIELAFFKAIRNCTDPERLNHLKLLYITLDKYMLTDDDCATLTRYYDFIDHNTGVLTYSPESIRGLANQVLSPEMQKAFEINKRLTESARRRLQLLKEPRWTPQNRA